MKSFICSVCSSVVYFNNYACVSCGTLLGYLRPEHALVAVNQHGIHVDASGNSWRMCRNAQLSGCNWLADSEQGYCFSCGLTRTRPSDTDVQGLENYAPAERAKRRLIAELDQLELPILTRAENPESGLAFDLLSSHEQPVSTGHDNGIITLDLAESDDAYRARLRLDLEEPYRTVLGHFRHEIGHYYQMVLVGDDKLEACRKLFGDERIDYQKAIEQHYQGGAPDDWQTRFISKYASMHPWEDFAETFAHFLHICAAMDTAHACGLWPQSVPTQFNSFREMLVTAWIPMSAGLNQINRSMGKDDLYPFVLSPPVLNKLQFVADLVPHVHDAMHNRQTSGAEVINVF